MNNNQWRGGGVDSLNKSVNFERCKKKQRMKGQKINNGKKEERKR